MFSFASSSVVVHADVLKWQRLSWQAAAVAEAEVTALLNIHEIATALEAEKRRMLATIDSQQASILF